ncbi:VOC family protein [Catellatospora tritici]|uniref:VOC family protein n=1 Tax=Catellatospora tritici TaxID=2851566 RepID=UPI001C2CECD7|nr:VOC family protein [Catellatospora tritici]MBV1853627.1 VOC family protein [Catellatospora tritici]
MRLRMELFVDDLDTSVAFYADVLGFTVLRRERGYASLRRGAAVLGLGRSHDLPADDNGPGFSQARLAVDKGAGVEIVFELDDTDQLARAYDRCRGEWTIVEPLQSRPWGLSDFRVVDPDGYYLRITHGDYAADEI